MTTQVRSIPLLKLVSGKISMPGTACQIVLFCTTGDFAPSENDTIPNEKIREVNATLPEDLVEFQKHIEQHSTGYSEHELSAARSFLQRVSSETTPVTIIVGTDALL